jgi:general secretion pathway protein D
MLRNAKHLCLLFTVALAFSQASGQSTQTSTAPPNKSISLNFPEAVPLKVLIDFVSQRLSLNILYDDQFVGQRVSIQAPVKISETELLGLLKSVLQSRGLALVDANVAGFMRVIPLPAAAQINQQPGAPLTRVFHLAHADAAKIDPIIKPLLTQPGGNSLALPEQHELIVTDFPGTIDRIADALRLIDTPAQNITVQFIPIRYADPAQLTRQLEQALAAQSRVAKTPDNSDDTSQSEMSYDQRTAQLMIVAPPDRIESAKQIIRALDIPVTESQSPVRFYKLANTTATDVLATIVALEGAQSSHSSDQSAAAQRPSSPAPAGRGQGESISSSPTAPAMAISPNTPGSLAAPAQQDLRPRESIRTKQAQITADPNTNTIIVVADPAVQRQYEQLIKSLDKRRPQVLIEATIVTLDTTDNYQFGVEVSAHGRSNPTKVVTFSSFGLSTPDPKSGDLALIPGQGFNGALLPAGYADLIIRALKTNSRARVSSAPRILVNDNATGTLTSIAEQPFTSVNAATTISTTSFAGYAEAGTEVTLTPHISEKDYLQLEYVVSLSSFTGDSSNGIPPPRQRDAVQSKVTIPDGSTIVVGGLNRKSTSFTKTGIPILGDIPILEYLFSNRTNNSQNTTLFVFLRPVILRDDQFEDLKSLSERDLKPAGLPSNFPASEPLEMK